MLLPASRGVNVAPDGTISGVDGTRYRLLHLPGLMLDARTVPEQEHYSYLLGTLAAGLPHKARLSIFIENRPVDADALTRLLQRQITADAYTEALGELGAGLRSWWTRRLTAVGQRHVPALAYWLLVSPYPVQDGYPDQTPEARLAAAVEALTRYAERVTQDDDRPEVILSDLPFYSLSSPHLVVATTWGRASGKSKMMTGPASRRPPRSEHLQLRGDPLHRVLDCALGQSRGQHPMAYWPAVRIAVAAGLGRIWRRRGERGLPVP